MNLWLEIPVADRSLVQHDETFEDLGRDLDRGNDWVVVGNVFTEVAVLDVLHSDVHRVASDILEPPEEQNEEVRVLMYIFSCEDCTNSRKMDTHVLQFNQRLQLLDIQVVPGYDLHSSQLPQIIALPPDDTKGTGPELLLGDPNCPHFHTALPCFEVRLLRGVRDSRAIEGGGKLMADEEGTGGR